MIFRENKWLFLVILMGFVVLLGQVVSADVEADILYLVEDSRGIDSFLIDEIESRGYSYEVVFEDVLGGVDFRDYRALIVGDQRFSDPSSIPIGEIPSIVINSYDYSKRSLDYRLGLSWDSGSVGSPSLLISRNHLEGIFFDDFVAYSVSNPGTKTWYLNGQKPADLRTIISTSDPNDAVVALLPSGSDLLGGREVEHDVLFFGITDVEYWTQDTRDLFGIVLDLLSGVDEDGDDFYNNVDCDDEDAEINPGSSDLEKNCVNDPPYFVGNREFTFDEGDLVIISVEAGDPEGDSLSYSSDDGRFSSQGNEFSWQTDHDDSGEHRIDFSISDSEFSVSEEYVITIIEKNQAPEFFEIPDLTWDEDSVFTFDVNDYVFDPDLSGELVIGVHDTSTDQFIRGEKVSEGIYEFSTDENFVGSDWIVFWVNDGEGTGLSDRVNLIVENVPDEIDFVEDISDLEWAENTDFDNAFNIYDHFNSVDSDLTFEILGNEEISVFIDGDGEVSFSPSAGFYGTESVSLIVSNLEYTAESNEFDLVVSEVGEVPEFLDLDCQTDIVEDQEYTCTLSASDEEGNEISFEVVSEDNGISCEISFDLLTYSALDSGMQACELSASDIHGADYYTLEVDASPVNDAPVIDSFGPLDFVVNLYDNQEKRFEINVSDSDDVNLDIDWFVDGVLGNENSGFFIFSKPEGSYVIRVEVDDGDLQVFREWRVIVGSLGGFTCSEVSGDVCSEGQACRGSFLGVKDSDVCCSVQCERAFLGVRTCSLIDGNLQLDIRKPTSTESIDVGGDMSIRLRLINRFTEDKEFDVRAYLYDLDRDKNIEDIDDEWTVSESDSELLELDLEIPEDLDLDRNYALFVSVLDDVCSQDYIELDVNRKDREVILTKFEFPDKVVCGEEYTASIKAENIGLKDQDITLSVKNADLRISKSSEKFEIENYDSGSEVETRELEIEISEDVAAGRHILEASVKGSGLRTYTLEKKIDVECESDVSVSFGNSGVSVGENLERLSNIILSSGDSEEGGIGIGVLGVFFSVFLVLVFGILIYLWRKV